MPSGCQDGSADMNAQDGKEAARKPEKKRQNTNTSNTNT
jgi:hypothetical protein